MYHLFEADSCYELGHLNVWLQMLYKPWLWIHLWVLSTKSSWERDNGLHKWNRKPLRHSPSYQLCFIYFLLLATPKTELDMKYIYCCESAALNMSANLENSAVATGLEKVSFHSNPKERQCQRMIKLPHSCTHLTC